MKAQKFFKLALPNGFDFYTGRTINYREHIGKEAVCPNFSINCSLCSSSVIHASRKPEQCFIGAKVPCSAYLVSGIPVLEDSDKCGFEKLLVIKELKPEKLFSWYEEATNLIHPFKVKPPEKITEKHLQLLKNWNSVGNSVGNSVWNSVWNSVGDSVWNSVRDSVGNSVRDSVGNSVGNSVWNSVRDSVGNSVRNSVWNSVWNSVGDSVWNSVRDSVGNSVRNSVRSYFGSIFQKSVKKWKYIDHKKGVYPFQSASDLWRQGLVPSFDGKIWRLHGKENAEVLWEGKI